MPIKSDTAEYALGGNAPIGLKPRTRDYPPRESTVAAGNKLNLAEMVRGEGFFDFLYVSVSDPSSATIVVELDGEKWLERTIGSMRLGATGLGIDGWFGFLGVQLYNQEDGYYAVSVVPVKDTAPFYRTLRVWVENTGSSSLTVRNGYMGYRIRERIDI